MKKLLIVICASLLLVNLTFLRFAAAENASGQIVVDSSFNPTVVNQVNSVVVQPDGKVLIGGRFPGGLTRVNGDGTLDTAFTPPGFTTAVNTVVLQADGKILVGSDGDNANNALARLNANGTLDTLFAPDMLTIVWAIAIQADGKILVGSCCGIVRVDAVTGATDSSFINPLGAFPNTVRTIAVQPDGLILIGGLFGEEGAIGTFIRRVAANGALDSSFNANVDSFVTDIALQADGKILVSGSFLNIGGQPRRHFARLNSTGAADAFNPNPDLNGVYSIAVQADGKILAGGNFQNIGGQSRNSRARLDATTGAADPSFIADCRGGAVNTIAVQTDGKIVVGGAFNSIDSTENFFHPYIARLIDNAPSAAMVSVGGQVLTANGNGLSRARVTLTDTNGTTRTAITNSFGYFRFDAIEAGQTYIISAFHKRFQFINQTQVVFVGDEITDLGFNALPE